MTRRRSGPLLLAVEDEPRNAALLEAILGRAGYRLHDRRRASPRPASSSTRRRLTCVLLDRHLPDGDGLDLIPEIRGSEPARRRADPARQRQRLPRDVQAAMDAGCDGFLAKPVRVKPLVDEVGGSWTRRRCTASSPPRVARCAETGRLAAARGPARAARAAAAWVGWAGGEPKGL